MKELLKRFWKKLKWWTGAENKHCNSFCPTCSYYNRCVYDTLVEKNLEKYNEAKTNIASIYGISVDEVETFIKDNEE